MRGHPVSTAIFLSGALVVLTWVFVPNSLDLSSAKSQSPALSGKIGRKGKIPIPLQYHPDCLEAEKARLDLNLKRFSRKGVFSRRALLELARSFFILGEMRQSGAGEPYFRKGCHFAQLLRWTYPSRVEGHYWLALNLCGLCSSIGAGRALLLIPTIATHLEEALSLDPTYDQAGPLRALGRIRSKAPVWPLSEGDPIAALAYLQRAVHISPQNSTNHLYLAEALLDEGERAEACQELERAIISRKHAVSRCGLKEDRSQALSLMRRCTE